MDLGFWVGVVGLGVWFWFCRVSFCFRMVVCGGGGFAGCRLLVCFVFVFMRVVLNVVIHSS